MGKGGKLKFNGLRFTNISLLILLIILTFSGIYSLFWTINGWMFTVHRAAGWGLIALLPWKAAISYRSLRRGIKPNINRGLIVIVSLLLAMITILVLALALLWKGRFGPETYWLRQTAISWHWMLALGLLAPLAVHVWRRWPKPKPIDFTSRRAALRLFAASGLGLLGYGASQAIAQWRELPQAPRRFTGSREDGQNSGNQFPVTQTITVQPDQVDPQTWRLSVGGDAPRPLVLTYADLLALPAVEKIATLDCTLGWYSTQSWRGILLLDLLHRAGVTGEPASVQFESVTGYTCTFLYAEAKDVLLATHVGSEALALEHGFPIRAVVPSRRGWFWIKWLSRIDVQSTQIKP
jgi:DMSO/TMAO reductase YedYZ molybdopterin-dependent catalytic subunit